MPLSRRALTDKSYRASPSSLQLTLMSSEVEVRTTLQKVMQRADDWNLSEDASSSVEIVLAEALNNVVEHAYKGTPDGIIKVDCAFNGDNLSIMISDQGLPVPEAVFINKDNRMPTGDINDLPEGGFGWGLIRELTHDLKVSRIGKTTLLSLKINTD